MQNEATSEIPGYLRKALRLKDRILHSGGSMGLRARILNSVSVEINDDSKLLGSYPGNRPTHQLFQLNNLLFLLVYLLILHL